MSKNDKATTSGERLHPIIGKMQHLEDAFTHAGVHIGKQERIAIHQLVEVAEILERAVSTLAPLRDLSSSRTPLEDRLAKATESLASLEVDLCIELLGHLKELKTTLPALAEAVDAAAEQ